MTIRTKGEQKAYLDGYEMCGYCPFYDRDSMLCLIESAPIEWDLEDIKRRLNKIYGK